MFIKKRVDGDEDLGISTESVSQPKSEPGAQ